MAKNDDRDARGILALMRGHLLAGNSLPDIWIPDSAMRDDRELVRARLDGASKLAKVKNQIQSLLKRYEVRRAAGLGQGWTRRFEGWLWSMTRKRNADDSPIGPNTKVALQSLLRQMESLEKEIAKLDKAIIVLSKTPRYAKPAEAMLQLKGVGPLTAMVFLAEIGDLTRFANRRQLAGYLGLVPTSDESGQANDRKGHITHQGPPRVRKVLCQAVWSAIAHDPQMGAAYRRLVRKNPKHRKIAVVATMRRLSIIMWHRGLDALEPPPRRDVA
jgi:transposase